MRCKNLTGYENFDEGFSAHDTSEAFIEDSLPKTKEPVPVRALIRDTKIENGSGPTRRIGIDPGSDVTFEKTTITGLTLSSRSTTVKATDTLIDGKPWQP